MIPAYRFAEVAVYSVLNFFPYLMLAIYPFRKSLRFSRRNTTLLVLLLCAVQIFMGCVSAFYEGSRASVLSVVSTVSYAAFYFLAVKMPFGKTLFTLLMLSNAANFVVMASKCIEGQIFPELALQSYRWSFSLVMFFVELLLLIPLYFYIKKVYTPAVENEPSGIEWKFLWLIPATFYLIWFYEIYSGSSKSSLETALNPGNAVFLLFINVGAMLVYSVIAKLVLEQNKNMRLQASNHSLEMQSLQYENLQERITEARRAKHDVRHHIVLMQEYLKKKEYSELENYLNSYSESLPEDTPLSFCKNYAVNAVLAYFSQLSKVRRIDLSVHIDIPENCGIDDTDITVLFGNLLENAFEACERDGSENKKVIVRATNDEYSLCVAIDNTFTGKIKRNKSGAFVSSKHIGAGIGTESVKSIAEKYHGVCRFDNAGGMFYASVMINK